MLQQAWVVLMLFAASLAGEDGYFRLERETGNKKGLCGITQAASYPTKTHPNPKTVPTICGW